MAALLGQLAFIDERDDEAKALLDVGWYGKLGVVGPFLNTFGHPDRYVAEVASVYAERLHTLGYLALDRSVDAATHRDLAALAREEFDERDARRSEVEARIGPPNLVVGRRVCCYAARDADSGWVFFDYWSEDLVSPYEPGTGRRQRGAYGEGDPLLRNVRVPAATWEQSLVLTLYGKFLRWGSGWWVDHRTRSDGTETDAIAAQLRAIREADPSQAQSSDS